MQKDTLADNSVKEKWYHIGLSFLHWIAICFITASMFNIYFNGDSSRLIKVLALTAALMNMRSVVAGIKKEKYF